MLVAEVSWKAGTKEGDSPVSETNRAVEYIPEYNETREILLESGGTTLQG